MKRPTGSGPQSALSLLASRHNGYERRAFDYFIHNMAGIFVPAVDARFWKDLIPCLCQTYSFVWDIVVCCSILTEHGSYSSLTATSDSMNPMKVITHEHRRALKHYNQAISNVRQLAHYDQADESLMVLSYILFASVEFVQQNVKTGNDLVRKCCKILAHNLTSTNDRQYSAASQAVHQVVTPFVLRRGIVIATFGNSSQPQGVTEQDTSNSNVGALLSRFSELDEARTVLIGLMHDCYNIIRHADFLPQLKDNDSRKILFMSQRQSLLNGLMQWKASFIALSRDMLDGEAEWTSSYMMTYWTVCYVSLAACVSPFETTFDNYMHHFAEIIRYGTICSKASIKSSTLPGFEAGLVAPFYFCATKCRHPILRREALRLLRLVPKPEGLWAFAAPDRVVATVILAEEREAQPFITGYPISQHAVLAPEERRYAYVSVVGRQAPGGKWRQAVEMSRFDDATSSSRKLVSEYAWLEDTYEV